ncbi:MAG: tRNA (adenosine(37)-N6)-threonylcarbamoyltransferase complex transferase subunit TsaD [Deltaproteobacteria bacterium]|nr:tRNA (adenosine(37)-N6)-threonylcarbamoyltransferase complex transferase subunit TsaD [Deltaproteobacteria bacterium]
MTPLLAIETSCDETSAAVIGDGGVVLSCVVRSQIEDHMEFGGVVPELASRRHIEWIDAVVAEALTQADVRLDDLKSVGVTRGPGLVGCLLVGLAWAQGLVVGRGIPLLGVNHLEGHLLASFVGQETPPFPFLALTVSGGHTSLVHCHGVGEYEVLGSTLDDAAGEAFDKSARLLGLPYPGGVHVDRLAQTGNPHAVALPRGMSKKPGYNFSFSGLKTAVWKHINEHGVPEGQALADFCASLQEAIVDALLLKTRKAARELGVTRVVATGGVAANSRLRSAIAEMADKEGWEVHRPEMRFCTDNAGMIGYAAWLRLARGERSDLNVDVAPGLALGVRA